MTSIDRPMWVWILFPAVTMSLGWGLRGFIGGGSLGAMIPGALVAMALCLLLDREDQDTALIAAFGAVGIGFGGQETYGQTIGLAVTPATMAWGLAGLALKGAVWGLLGGGLLGVAFIREQYSRRALLIALALMVAGTFAGWKLINEPKLIYFSNLSDKPRAELWAGLLIGAGLLLFWLRSYVPILFAFCGAMGGGLGFGIGGWFQVWGRANAPHPVVGWWKVMEFFFGLLFGAALGYAAWRARDKLTRPNQALPLHPLWSQLGLGLIVVLFTLFMEFHLPLRFNYTVAGAVLLAFLLYAGAAWHAAITLTFCAFALDNLKGKQGSHPIEWTLIILATVAVGLLVSRKPQLRFLFLLLLWTSVADSWLKAFSLGFRNEEAVGTQAVFTLLGLLATAFYFRFCSAKTLR